MILSAPHVERTDEQSSEITHLTLSHIIGGYDFDMKNKLRLRSTYDFVYDIVRS